MIGERRAQRDGQKHKRAPKEDGEPAVQRGQRSVNPTVSRRRIWCGGGLGLAHNGEARHAPNGIALEVFPRANVHRRLVGPLSGSLWLLRVRS